MKSFDLEYNLIKAAPAGSPVDAAFTKRVMYRIAMPTLEKGMPKKTRHPLFFRLRHLPKFAVILLALAFLLTISGVTYAIVETVKQQQAANVTIDSSGVNEHGREQLSVRFDSCAEQKKSGTTYELKKDSGLSAEDGAKVLQAQCERDSILTWVKKDPALNKNGTDPNAFYSMMGSDGFVGTFRGLNETGMSLDSASAFGINEQRQTLPFPENARVVQDWKTMDSTILKPGNTIFYFSPNIDPKRSVSGPRVRSYDNVVVFKLSLDAKYYSIDMQSYVRARQPCENNQTSTCIVSNHINTVNLTVARGGALPSEPDELANKIIQGKVVSWNNTEIKLDVGKGVIYTLRTPSSVIDRYNQTTVYGLKSYDMVYAKTDPEELKIAVGDSLEIYYREQANQSAPALEWSQINTINLMVERKTGDLEVLRKY